MTAIGPLVTIAVPIEISGKAPSAHFSPETLTPTPGAGSPLPRVVWNPSASCSISIEPQGKACAAA